LHFALSIEHLAAYHDSGHGDSYNYRQFPLRLMMAGFAYFEYSETRAAAIMINDSVDQRVISYQTTFRQVKPRNWRLPI